MEEEQEKREGHKPRDDTESRVYSIQDVISAEDYAACMEKLKSRERSIYEYDFVSEGDIEEQGLHERFWKLRITDFEDYKRKHPDHIGPVPTVEYPLWNECCNPNRIFDWTINTMLLRITGLNDYQRIVPTREAAMEYLDWEKYSKTFSTYETDIEYLKYCNENKKKIKWIEEYVVNLRRQDLLCQASSQAMKIAAEFRHLPASLATLGYDEYIEDVAFTDALRDIKDLFPSRAAIIEAELEGLSPIGIQDQFYFCMARISEHAAEDGKVFNEINYMVYNMLGRPKIFADYVKKKLQIGKRLGLIPSSLTEDSNTKN
ncbi:hypothetical protein ACP4OV_012763 [Aristida adscensionis]